ncbi:MAG: DUF4143 domain-containing protein [Eubacteriales bacterium]|nr:DUF4143 domain-containing protein [Eubacteriales bacterium]
MYLPRLIEKTIKNKLSYIGAVQIEGPKWCGKSTTASLYAKTIIKLQDPIVYNRYKIYATTSKEDLLYGDKPVLFDEWQKIPELWDFIRLDIDDHPGVPGLYMLTGSAKPAEDNTRHSGAGRIAKIKMRPLSLFESKDSSGEVSVSELFNNPDYHVKGGCGLTISNQIDLVCRGGWPGILTSPKSGISAYIRDYYEGLINTDITDVDGIKRNTNRAKAILKSYARGISTLTDYQTMVKDLENAGEGVDIKTLGSYISAFEKLFIIENVEAWTPKLRSASKIRTKAKKQFTDPSIAVVALGAGAKELSEDMETFGFFFESMVIRDLRIYLEPLNGEVYHYQDNTGLEADCILKLDDGRWAAVEVKVGGNKIDEAAANLLKLRDRVDTAHMRKPEFLMVVYGGQYAYRRPDGVFAVPAGCLRN